MFRLEVVVKNSRDLSRQVVKSDYSTISIPELGKKQNSFNIYCMDIRKNAV